MADEFPSLYTPPAGGPAAGPAAGVPGGSSSQIGGGSSAAAVLEQMHAANADGHQGDAAGDAAGSGSGSGEGSSKQQQSQQRRDGGGSARNNLDLGNEELFPSLGAPSAPFGKGKGSTAPGGWGAAARSRQQAAQQQQQQQQAQAAQQQLHTDILTLPTSGISVTPVQQRGGFSNAPPEATTLGGVLSQLMQRFNGVKLESSSSTAKGTTTILIKAQRSQDIERVKRELMARIVKKVNETLQVPASTRAFIIGAKGRTLKSIVEETGVNIQIPRDNGGPAASAAAAAPASDEPDYVDENGSGEQEVEDPLIPINLFGDAPSVQAAKQRILAIVNERTSRTSTKLSTVPHQLYHLLSAKLARGEIISSDDTDNLDIRIPPVWKLRAGAGRGVSANDAASGGIESGDATDGSGTAAEGRDLSISIAGEREAVNRAVEALSAAAEELGRTSQAISMTLNKRQHRFILPPVSDQILEATRCAIEVPPASDPSEQITIRGPQAQLVQALQEVMNRASAAAVDTVDLSTIHGINTPPSYVKRVARYLIVKGKLRKIADEESVQIFIPRAGDVHTTIDIVATQGPKGPQAAVSSARGKVVEALKPLSPSAFANVEVDPLVHRFLIGKKGSKISQFEEKNSVQVVFPPSSSASASSSTDSEDAKNILLVYVGQDTSSASKTLGEVKEEILKLAKEAADITSTTLKIPAKLHRFIIGPAGTTLNALIGTGDERIVNVRFGSTGAGRDSKGATGGDEDEVVIRGPSDEVKKTVKEIERIAEEAKNDEIVNSYTVEFDIEQRFVSHIVGRGGAGVQKLRDDLGVRIDFGDSASAASGGLVDGQTVKSKKSSSASASAGKSGAKAQVKIQGRKENVEEAKKRVLKQVEQLADETTLSVPMLSGTERGNLIGKQGAYVQRLESKYDVRINFPRAGEDDASSSAAGDVITIRGGKKGAEGAKRELVELMEYEKENNQTSTLTVPGKSLARIFGRQGQAIRELQDETSAEIDVQKKDGGDQNAPATVTIRGTKQAIAAAKKQLQAIVAEVQDETTLEMQIERQYHVNIIGKGGQNIRDIISRAGGPSDSKAAGQMVRFPRAGESDAIVTIRAPSSIASKIKSELESQLAGLRDRVVYGIAVPQSAHARLIGRGGAGVNELQRKHSVRIVMSNWSEFRTSGEVVNPDDIEGQADTDIIKVLGSQKNAEAAAAEIKEKVASAQQQQGGAGQARNGGARQGGQQQQQQEQPIAKTVNVPSHLHSRVTQGGKFFRNLPSGIRIDHGDVQPPTSSSSGARVNGSSSNGAGKSARIDEDGADAEDSDFHWDVQPLSSATTEGSYDVPWNIRGTDDEKVQRVEGMINAALKRCEQETHRGVLTVPQSLIPRIVGRQGSGLEKLRAVGVSAEVEGRSGANSVIFIGTPENLEEARQMVVELRDAQRNRA